MGCEKRRRPERLDPPEQRSSRTRGPDRETDDVLRCLRLIRSRRQRAGEGFERETSLPSVPLSFECLGKAETNA